jgi:uncharacterized delta-60 repeat protein
MKMLSYLCSVLLCLIATVLFVTAFWPGSAVRTDTRNQPPQTKVQLTGREASEYLSQNNDGQSLMQALTAARFGFRWQERALSGEDRGGYVAINDEQNFSASFDADGEAYVRSNGEQKWQARLKLKSYGYGKQMVDVPPIVSRQVKENRIEYERKSQKAQVGSPRSDPQLIEWYVNKPEGLEQGFTIFTRPAARRDAPEFLRVVLSVTGTVALEKNASGDGLRWKDRAGRVVSTYDHLRAWDASGRELPARMLVKANELALEVDDNGATYPLTIDPILQGQVEVTAPDGAKLDELGLSVAISGNTAVVGAPYVKSDTNQRTGAAYVFVRNGADWAFQQKLLTFDTPLDGNTVYNFGISVGISGNTIVVGSLPNGFDNRLPFNGVAHIFVRTGTTWKPQQKLMADDGGGGDHFGISVAISGDTVIVGSDYTVTNANLSPGEAFIFSRNGTTWTKQAKLLEPVSAQIFFGLSVAVNGDTAVVGSPIHSNNGNGAAYVFVRSNNAWSVQPPLLPSNPSGADEFGNSVGVSGDTIIVGAPAHDVNSVNDQGAAYVFTRTGNAWSQQQILTASDGSVGNVFGNSVAISGNQLVIGAHLAYVNGVQQQGKAYRFARLATTWLPVAAPDGRPFLTAADGSDFTAFGVSVAISGDTVIAGAVGLNNSTGAAYIFQTLDSDGDGIPDDWETRGITVASNGTITVGKTGSGEFIDLPAMGANPMHKDIFIHADWMTGIKPNARTIKVVTDAFRDAPVTNPDGKKGINLHIDLGPDSVMDPVSGKTWGALSRSGPESFQTSIGVDSPNANPPPANVYNWGTVDTLKDDYFNAAKRKSVFHYLLFCNKYATSDSSGISRGIPAGDFLVALGQVPVPGATLRQIAGTLMHELGHNLGLLHGGNEDVNMKPNYLSIMSYTFQMEGLLERDRRSRTLDYSRSTLDPLNENFLNENVGINDPAGHLTLWKWPAPNNSYNQAFYPSAALDWNLDGVQNDAPVSVNLNCDTTVEPNCDTKLTTLTGFTDWPALIFNGDGAIGNSAAGMEVFQPQRTVEDEASFSDIISLIPQGLLAQDAVEPLDVVTFSPQETTTGSTVSFDGSGSTAVTGTIVSWTWDFGDGTTGTGPIVSHVYTAAGDYVVTLMVTDSNGNVNMTPLRYIVTVTAAPTPTPTPTPASTPTLGDVDPTFKAAVTNNRGGSVNVILPQPDGKFFVGGEFDAFGGRARRGVARVNADGTCDETFDAGLAILHAVNPVDDAFLGGAFVDALALQPDGKLLVGINYISDPLFSHPSPFHVILRLNADGTLDSSFDSSALQIVGGMGGATCIALQADGKIIVGGNFLYTNSGQRGYLARLNSDGSIDPSFVVPLGLSKSGLGNDNYQALALQPDGKVIVSGSFVGGPPILRLNADGSLDPAFDAKDPATGNFVCGFAFGSTIRALGLQPDGKIVVGGILVPLDGSPSVAFARLNADGSQDQFTKSLTNGSSLALQSDGKIIVGGDFEVGGSPATSADTARLNPDGTLDPSFNVGSGTLNPNRQLGGGAVNAVALKSDGVVVIGGIFSHFNDLPAEDIIQLNPDGSRTAGFDSNGPGFNNEVLALVRQTDGKLLVGFLTQPASDSRSGDTPRAKLNSTRIGGIGRLNPDGTTDTSFTSPFDDGTNVQTIVLQPDGKILLSGSLHFIGVTDGTTVFFTRLNADGTLDTSFHPPSGLSGAPAVRSDGKIFVLQPLDSRTNMLVRLNPDGSKDADFALIRDGSATVSVFLPDGRLIITGSFLLPDGRAARIARLNSDGTFDTTFDPGTGPDNVLRAFLLEPDGKMLIAGDFFNYNGSPQNCLARLNADGSLDPSFLAADPNTFQSSPTLPKPIGALALQPDGKIIAGGSYRSDTFEATPNRLFRLNPDGTLDPSFPLGQGLEGTTFNINAIVLPPDGMIVLGGGFKAINGVARLGLARVLGTPPGAAQFVNISGRLRVETGDNVLIGGFIITGTQPKKVILRAIGPSLTQYGVPGALVDPMLELHNSSQVIASNNNWKDTQQAEIQASGLAPSNDLESAIITTLNPGAYTAIVAGVNNAAGVGLVEIYDLDRTVDSKLANISTRGLVQTGDNVMIAGLIIQGVDPTKVIVRAIGPSLGQYGITNPLQDPTLELHDGNGALISFNDNWKDSQQIDIQATGLAPSNDAESAILATLSPGPYTGIVRGNNNTSGVGLIEAYQLGN